MIVEPLTLARPKHQRASALCSSRSPPPSLAFLSFRQGAERRLVRFGAVVAPVLSFTHATIGSLFPALPEAIRDLNVGIIALAANIVALVVVSAVSRPRTVSVGAT